MAISFRVHPKYIQQVKVAWKRMSNGREQDLAEEIGQSQHIVNHFLEGRPVNGLNFLLICQKLGLNWREIAGLELPESQVPSSPVEVPHSRDAVDHPCPIPEPSTVNEALNDLLGTLCEMLRRLTRKAGDLLNADRASIFLLDPQRKTLASIIAEDGGGSSLVIEVPLDRGIASLAATSLKVINIPFDVYDDPRSEEAKKTDKKTAYRTYTVLAYPLLNKQKDLVAVVQLINKLKPTHDPDDDLSMRIDPKGFTHDDEELFAKFAPSILQTLERCQLCYQLIQKVRENATIVRGGVVLKNDELIVELKRKQQRLQKTLDRL